MLGGMTAKDALMVSSLYVQLVTHNILQEFVILVQGTGVCPHLLANAGYPSREYMLRNFKLANDNVDKFVLTCK